MTDKPKTRHSFTMKTSINGYMQQALKLAGVAAARGEVPVGALIVNGLTGEVLASTHNLVMTDKDPTAHAELLAIRAAAEKIGSERLVDCDLYVTLEPCPMCAQAISFARIRRVYYGADDPKGGGVDNGARVFNAPSCHHKPEVYGGIDEMQASQILKDFFKKRR